jgi:ribonuclease HII
MILAGIDEAGFGPVLGPLVVSATVLQVPDGSADECLWTRLASAVVKKPGRRKGRIAIGDSKKLYSRQNGAGLEHLERGVLAAMLGCGGHGRTLRELLQQVCPGVLAQVDTYPWYAELESPIPSCISETDLTLAGNALATAMREVGVSMLELVSEPVFVGEYNRLTEGTNNKSVTLMSVAWRLVMRIWESMRGGEARVYVDRQGGRSHYLQPLQQIFPGCEMKVLDESSRLSAYRVSDGRRSMELHFLVKGDEHQLPVALASMLSKYLREQLMGRFNSFWRGEIPEIEPTSGYYVDGNRFFQEILPRIERLGLDRRIIYRER